MAHITHEYHGKTKPDRQQKLEERHTDAKSRALNARSKLLELQVEERLGNVISRELVLKQLSYLLIKFRQRALSLPSAWSRRLLSIDDPREMTERLREMMTGLMQDLAGLPERCTDPEYDPEEEEPPVNGKPLVEVFANEKNDNENVLPW